MQLYEIIFVLLYFPAKAMPHLDSSMAEEREAIIFVAHH
jgi:hypothetical protein